SPRCPPTSGLLASSSTGTSPGRRASWRPSRSEAGDPMTDHHKFRYLLPPGNNFAFVAKFKIWIVVSILLMSVAIGSLFVNKSVRGEYMNWTIDFKGGTQIIYTFKNKTTHEY